MLQRMPSAVLFDMDGLMIDSERVVLGCWRQAGEEFGLTFDDAFLHSLVGLHDKLCRVAVATAFPEVNIPALFARTNTLYELQIESGLPSKPGIHALLRWLHDQGIPRAVATSTQRAKAELKLTHAGLREFFQVVVTGSDIEHPKPAPEIYLKVAEQLAISPAECLVLEDSEPGVRAALAAGMTVIQVPDLKLPDAAFRQLGHTVVDSLMDAHTLLRQAMSVERTL
jgi:HAD superfamily hydrolase (TIGR01509 family)